MPGLCSTDTEILWLKHFWLSWEHSTCLKENAFNYWFCLFGSSLKFRFWMRSYEISHSIQFIIAVRSQVKSVELMDNRSILNETPWGLKYLSFNVHEISLSKILPSLLSNSQDLQQCQPDLKYHLDCTYVFWACLEEPHASHSWEVWADNKPNLYHNEFDLSSGCPSLRNF